MKKEIETVQLEIQTKDLACEVASRNKKSNIENRQPLEINA